MRCLALAHELKNSGNKVSFLLALSPEPLKKRLVTEGHGVSFLPAQIDPGCDVDAHFTAGKAVELKAAHVVVDGYHFLTSYQRILKKANLELIYIDDLALCDYYCADFVLNQNPSASPSLYPDKAPQTKLLLGADYVLLRSEFLAFAKTNNQPEITPVAKNILVTMGGSDIDNVTAKAMEALSAAPAAMALQVTVVIGAGNNHGASLQKLAHRLTAAGAHTFKTRVSAEDMPQLLGQSDLVVSAGGTTVWEAAYLGRPVAVVITADNQKAGMERFGELGAVKLLGRQQDLDSGALSKPLIALIKDATRRQQLATQAASLIDGRGASRVVQKLSAKTV